MQRGRGWASLQPSNGQISGFPTEFDSVVAAQLSGGRQTLGEQSAFLR
jgi:hypothetical protein